MSPLVLVCQIIVAFGIYNVWLLRTKKETAWRGGNAKTMEEEFKVYGLSSTVMKIVGATKLLAATGLIIGLWYPSVTPIAAWVMALLMLVAVYMHMKVHDPLLKSLPAASMMFLSLIVAMMAAA